MTPVIKFIFDGTEITETPDGWQDIISSIQLVRDINALLETHEGTLTFKDDGYTYLKNVYDTSGWCAEVACEIYQYCDGVYNRFCNGLIKLSDIELDLKECTIKVKVLDNSFYSKINNNKSVEAFLWAGRSKNDTAIDITTLSDIEFFTPSSGTYTPVPVNPPYSSRGYRINDVFRYLIAFMTDDTVDYESSVFGTGGDFEGLSITCGYVVSTISNNAGTTEVQFKENFPSLSFDTVFKEVKKKRNIGLYVDYSTSRPKVRIEYDTSLRAESQSHSKTNLDGLKEIVTPENNYSKLRIGSSEITDLVPPAVQFPSDSVFIAWKDETYAILGNCNIDRELNLVSDWIIDNGIIEDLFVNNITDFDQDIILIDCDSTGAANQSPVDDTSSVAPFYYNKALSNRSVVESYFGGIPNTIAIYLGQSPDKFQASTTVLVPTLPLPSEPVPYQNDSTGGNFDTNNNFDSTTFFEYLVPSSGSYTFYTYTRIITNAVTAATADRDILVELRVYDVGGFLGGTLLSTYTIASKSILNRPVQTDVLTGSKLLVLSAGQTVLVRISVTNVDGMIYPGSYFSCIETHESGLTNTIDNNEYFNINHQFETPLTSSEYNSIARNVTGYISFGRYQEKIYRGWIQSLKYRRFAGTASFTTLTSKNKTK